MNLLPKVSFVYLLFVYVCISTIYHQQFNILWANCHAVILRLSALRPKSGNWDLQPGSLFFVFFCIICMSVFYQIVLFIWFVLCVLECNYFCLRLQLSTYARPESNYFCLHKLPSDLGPGLGTYGFQNFFFLCIVCIRSRRNPEARNAGPHRAKLCTVRGRTTQAPNLPSKLSFVSFVELVNLFNSRPFN